MIRKHISVSVFHFLCIVLVLNLLYLILPCSITRHYFRLANFILCVIIAKLTLGISKKVLMNEKLQPDGKAVLITGCARGIGNALAKYLDSQGYHVFASCRSVDSPGAHELRKSCSSRLKILQLDVTEDESVQKAVEFVKNNLGECELWAVVNNAGIQKGFYTELASIQAFKDTMDTNAIGTVRVTKAFLPLLRESKGRVINVTSLSARTPLVFAPSYTMSKWAVTGFSECLRHEMDMWGIKVITIQPEVFETDLANRACIVKRMDEEFASIDKETLEVYGEEFLSNFKAFVARFYISTHKMQILLDALENAISLKNPDPVYAVVRNKFISCFATIFELSPAACQLMFYRLCCFIGGIGKPTAAKKNL